MEVEGFYKIWALLNHMAQVLCVIGAHPPSPRSCPPKGSDGRTSLYSCHSRCSGVPGAAGRCGKYHCSARWFDDCLQAPPWSCRTKDEGVCMFPSKRKLSLV